MIKSKHIMVFKFFLPLKDQNAGKYDGQRVNGRKSTYDPEEPTGLSYRRWSYA